ncbi:hypothetical protein [Desulfovibrio falkowii]|uniref:Uncharacterized protein n=1 Tax=Desulfovibrio falkowii TaxID=3136602 RepID=A0ABQ0E7Y1_9BACT
MPELIALTVPGIVLCVGGVLLDEPIMAKWGIRFICLSLFIIAVAACLRIGG